MKPKIILITSSKNKSNLTFNLTKSSPNQQNIILVLLKPNQDLTLTTQTIHQISHSRSQTIIRGLVTQNSHLNIRSLVKIPLKTKQSLASLDQQVLLLSPTGSAQTQPYLEVADQTAQATHSSKIFHIDQNQLLYLQSRGFSHKKALKILTQIFFTKSLSQLTYHQKYDKIYQSINNYI